VALFKDAIRAQSTVKKDEIVDSTPTPADINDFTRRIRHLARTGKLKIECAPIERIRFLAPIAREFFASVLEIDFDDCLVTDESYLHDFITDENEAFYKQRALELYGIDLDEPSDNLVAILERIAPSSHD